MMRVIHLGKNPANNKPGYLNKYRQETQSNKGIKAIV